MKKPKHLSDSKGKGSEKVSQRNREYDVKTKRINLAIPEGMKEPLKARAHALCYSVQDYLLELARREIFGTGGGGGKLLGGGVGGAPVNAYQPPPTPPPTLRRESDSGEKGTGPLDQ